MAERRKSSKPKAAAPKRRASDGIKQDKNYDARPGYDPKFVGFAAPLPKLSKAAAKQAATIPVKKKSENKHELKYHHYSVILNAARKLAFVAAVNYDGKAKTRVTRTGPDKWFADPRVDKEAQTSNALYAKNALDRGHLVRRADAGWGATKDEAKRANDDTFHFTNCSPQHEVFNQSAQASKRNLKLWGNLENHIAEQVSKDSQRLSIFNGPVFRADDREHRKVKVPKQFFKIVICKKDDGTPAAYGFLLSQEQFVRDLPLEALEAFEPGPFKVFQVPISEIEKKTQLDFGPLKDFDTKRRGGEESLEAFGPTAITSLNQIVL
ncbi:MAG TPA: DNA/RNA non-specific endonuclease [Thermoanaerobaculia bacterium]|jgi:endonuclease G|nr:DNA/RNA non-specific endonuclease [Thermoanaerobaculia bacterium]